MGIRVCGFGAMFNNYKGVRGLEIAQRPKIDENDKIASVHTCLAPLLFHHTKLHLMSAASAGIRNLPAVLDVLYDDEVD